MDFPDAAAVFCAKSANACRIWRAVLRFSRPRVFRKRREEGRAGRMARGRSREGAACCGHAVPPRPQRCRPAWKGPAPPWPPVGDREAFTRPIGLPRFPRPAQTLSSPALGAAPGPGGSDPIPLPRQAGRTMLPAHRSARHGPLPPRIEYASGECDYEGYPAGGSLGPGSTERRSLRTGCGHPGAPGVHGFSISSRMFGKQELRKERYTPTRIAAVGPPTESHARGPEETRN